MHMLHNITNQSAFDSAKRDGKEYYKGSTSLKDKFTSGSGEYTKDDEDILEI